MWLVPVTIHSLRRISVGHITQVNVTIHPALRTIGALIVESGVIQYKYARRKNATIVTITIVVPVVVVTCTKMKAHQKQKLIN